MISMIMNTDPQNDSVQHATFPSPFERFPSDVTDRSCNEAMLPSCFFLFFLDFHLYFYSNSFLLVTQKKINILSHQTGIFFL